MLCNPPQPEDADICDEPDASGAGVFAGATGADESTGVGLPGTGDSEESVPFTSSGRGLRAPRISTRLVVLFRCLYRLLSRLLLLLNSKGPGLGGYYELALCVAGKYMLVFAEAVFSSVLLSNGFYRVAMRLPRLLPPLVRLLSTCSRLTLERPPSIVGIRRLLFVGPYRRRALLSWLWM